MSKDLEKQNTQAETERQRWQGIVEGIADEVWVCDMQGKMSLLNLGSVTPMGLEEFKDKKITEVLDEVEILDIEGRIRPVEQSPLLLSLKGDIVRGEEIMRQRRTGRLRYRRYSSGPMHDREGNVIGSVAIVRDITDFKMADIELRMAHEKMANILESIGDAFYHLDENMNFTYINRLSENLWHRRREDLLGRSMWECFPQAVGSETYRAHVRAFQEKQPVHLETMSAIINAWISLSIYPAEDGISVYFRDISEQKKAEEALRFSEEKFSLAFFNNPAALVLTTLEEGIFLDLNATWEGMMGFSKAEVLGRSSRDLPVWPALEDRQRFTQELKSKGSLHWMEQEFLKKSGESFYAELSAQVLTLNGREVILSALIDVTERKQYQMKLKDYAEKLENSNRELQDFAYVASHDLQEPLRKVSAFGNSLNERLEGRLTEPEQDQFNRLLKSTARMQNMIADLLELSRVTTQGQPFRKVDMEKVAAEVMTDLELTISKLNGKVKIGHIPSVQGDPIQIQRLIMNLIGNGLKYHKMDIPPVVKIHGKKHAENGGDFVQIKVEDNGIGFDMQYAGVIFQPFHRLNGRTQYEGTGIGLAICKRIVERHGGSISASSKPGIGSTFVITLPAA